MVKKLHPIETDDSNEPTSNVVGEKDEVLYQCEECNFKYKDKDTAYKCEAWCHEYQSCNLDITKNAVR